MVDDQNPVISSLVEVFDNYALRDIPGAIVGYFRVFPVLNLITIG
jgi:hypothetical protein